MKAWQTACIVDEDVFAQYGEGEEVRTSVIVRPEWRDDFSPGNRIEVFLKSTAPGHPHHTGYITQNHGLTGAGSEALLISVQRT